MRMHICRKRERAARQMRKQQLNWMRLQKREATKCIKGEWEGWKVENGKERNSKQAEGETKNGR